MKLFNQINRDYKDRIELMEKQISNLCPRNKNQQQEHECLLLFEAQKYYDRGLNQFKIQNTFIIAIASIIGLLISVLILLHDYDITSKVNKNIDKAFEENRNKYELLMIYEHQKYIYIYDMLVRDLNPTSEQGKNNLNLIKNFIEKKYGLGLNIKWSPVDYYYLGLYFHVKSTDLDESKYLDSAESMYNDCIKIDNTFAKAWNNLGLIYKSKYVKDHNTINKNQALDYFNESYKQGYNQALFNKGSFLMSVESYDKKDNKDKLDIFRKVISNDYSVMSQPKYSFWARLNESIICQILFLKFHDHTYRDSTIYYYELARQEFPSEPLPKFFDNENKFNLAYCYYKQNKKALAIALLNEIGIKKIKSEKFQPLVQKREREKMLNELKL